MYFVLTTNSARRKRRWVKEQEKNECDAEWEWARSECVVENICYVAHKLACLVPFSVSKNPSAHTYTAHTKWFRIEMKIQRDKWIRRSQRNCCMNYEMPICPSCCPNMCLVQYFTVQFTNASAKGSHRTSRWVLRTTLCHFVVLAIENYVHPSEQYDSRWPSKASRGHTYRYTQTPTYSCTCYRRA